MAAQACLGRGLGENRLAFEYARSHSFERYKLGQIGEGDLHKDLYSNALMFGQIDYLVDMKRNLARQARQRRDHTGAALHGSDAGFRLAQLGLRAEAAEVLAEAADEVAAEAVEEAVVAEAEADEKA